ncbi:hypothetical protein D3C72_848400 [compost metagenome]
MPPGLSRLPGFEVMWSRQLGTGSTSFGRGLAAGAAAVAAVGAAPPVGSLRAVLVALAVLTVLAVLVVLTGLTDLPALLNARTMGRFLQLGVVSFL